MTIKNLHQRKITAARRAEFADSLAALEARIAAGEGDPVGNKLAAADLRSYIEEFDRDLAEFDALPTTESIEISDIAGIGTALINARIAAGLTQADLAQRVGLQTSAINRYEADDYQSAKLPRLHQIAQALNFNLVATLTRA